MASPNISFDTIPDSIRSPGKYMEFNTKLAVRALPGNPQTVLILGQMLDTGLATPLEPIDIFSDDSAAILFGRGSLAHLMAKEAITANSYLRLQVIGIEDSTTGQAATGNVTLTGSATGTGTLSVFVGNVRINIAATAGDDIAILTTEIAAALSQDENLPITTIVKNDTIVITARNKGAIGNDITLRITSTVPGVTATASLMSGGENDPDITPALTAVFAAGHNIIVCPYSTQEALTVLRDHLDATGNAIEKRGAIGVAGWVKSLSTGTTLAIKINDGRTTIGWYNGSVLLPGVVAAGYAAVIAGEEDPARPLNTLQIKGLDIIPLTSRISRNERENALWNGLTPLEVGAGERVQISRAITTYITNETGTTGPSMLDLTTIRTMDYCRKAYIERMELRFPHSKLSSRTPDQVRSELIDVSYKLEELEIIENVAEHLPMLIVERDSQDVNQLNAAIPADIVNGLHVLASRLDLIL